MKQIITIGKYTLVCTCSACPEQYDVYEAPMSKNYEENKNVAYLRLRHGRFRADVPFGGKTVYEAFPNGDGCFDPDERDRYLNEAISAIDAYRSGNFTDYTESRATWTES